MITIPWPKMRLILLLEAVLFGSSFIICGLHTECPLSFILSLGYIISLFLAFTALLFRVDAGGAACKALQRRQHDLLNHLQVIYGYLQLGKTEQALEYVDGILGEL